MKQLYSPHIALRYLCGDTVLTRNGSMPVMLLLTLLMLLPVGPAVSPTEAATGDVIATTLFSKQCEDDVGVGLAFDGTNLWYTCSVNPPTAPGPLTLDLHK